jgi:hypothetical protein
MKLIEPWAWRSMASAGALGLSLGLMAVSPAWAVDSPLDQRVEPENMVDKSTVGQAQTLHQLTEMQARMESMQRDYNARLQQMQATINILTAEIHKTGKTDAKSPETAPETAPRVASVEKPVDPSDEGIGEELIFGADEPATGTTGSLLGQGAATSARPLSAGGFGLGGRSVLDAASQPFSTSGAGLGQIFNPDIVVSGDFVGHYANRKSVADRGRVSLREAEFGFSAAIDPYAKAAFIFSKPDGENLGVEEGYVTLLSLPYGIQAKVGQMRSPFGKINVIHDHDLPQTDRPDVYVNFFGDGGLVESGVAMSKIMPTPWFSSLDVQVANGDNSTFFGHGRLGKPLVVSRWKNFFELSDTQTMEVGLSGAVAPASQDAGGHFSKVGGLDLTYRWLPPNQFHAFIWQTELLAAQRKNPALDNNFVFGGYSYMEYKLNYRWHAGVRVDYTQYPSLPNAKTIAVAPYVDFWESEFARWRAEYKHTFGDSQVRSSDQAWLQYSIILGLHPPHTF